MDSKLTTTDVMDEASATLKNGTALQRCVNQELDRYFDLLEGQAPHELHRMVIQQVETALIQYVLEECRGNQSKASNWLGISRGTLRCKLADINKRRQQF